MASQGTHLERVGLGVEVQQREVRVAVAVLVDADGARDACSRPTQTLASAA